MLNLDKVILDNYNNRSVQISETEVKLASDRFMGFVSLLDKIKRRMDEELSQKSKPEISFAESDILEEI